MTKNNLNDHARKSFGTAVIIATAGTFAATAFAQQPDLEEVVVTGTRIKRIDAEMAMPVQIVTQEDIQHTGSTTVEQLLQNVSVAVQGNSNSVAATGVGATSGGVSGISLRGLGSQLTLVLINGRRVSGGGTITDSNTVDVNDIPLAAVERVEVLKDGASAIYGSDAIAGVVNFILRDNYQGAEITASGGGAEDGGATLKRMTGTVGFGDLNQDRYNVLLVASYQKENALYGSQRDFAKSSINETTGNDTTSGNTYPANITDVDGVYFGSSNPAAPNCSPSVFDPLLSTSACRYDPASALSLLPESENASAYSALHFNLTDEAQLYAEVSYSRKKHRYVYQPVPISDQFAIPSNHPLAGQAPYDNGDGTASATIILTPSSPYYPTSYVTSLTGGATPDLLVRYRSFGTGNRDYTTISKQPRGVFGIKGSLAGWDYDAAFLYSRTELSEIDNGGMPLYSKILPLLNSGQVNFFGPNTPEVQAQLDATQFYGEAYSTRTSVEGISGSASRELAKLSAGSLAVAVGGEFRKEKFSANPSYALQIGDNANYGGNFLPVDKSRDVSAIYGELSVPIIRTLEADLAVRYDHYQRTGSKTTPKMTVRWRPTEQLLVRGSYGKGFRAPSLTELYSPQTQGVTSAGLNDPARCGNGGNTDPLDCSTQFTTVFGGNADLRAEESTTYTFGMVYAPIERVSIALDGFKINLTETIIPGIDPSVILSDPQFASFVVRGAPDPATPGLPGHISLIKQIYLNFGETRTQGLDLDLKGVVALPVGKLTLNLSGTYLDKYEIQNLDGTFTSYNGSVSPITNGQGGAIPRWHHYLSADWAVGPWDFFLSHNFQSRYHDIPGNVSGDDRMVASYLIWNGQVVYGGFKNLKLALGIKNLLNRDPPYTNAGGSNYFQSGYDPGYADPRGRFYYGSITYSFKPSI